MLNKSLLKEEVVTFLKFIFILHVILILYIYVCVPHAWFIPSGALELELWTVVNPIVGAKY